MWCGYIFFQKLADNSWKNLAISTMPSTFPSAAFSRKATLARISLHFFDIILCDINHLIWPDPLSILEHAIRTVTWNARVTKRIIHEKK